MNEPRVRPDRISPQLKGGERHELLRIDLAADELRVSPRVLRKGWEQGNIRGMKHAGKLYVFMRDAEIRAEAVLVFQAQSETNRKHRHG